MYAVYYIPQVCLRRTNEEPLLAIPLSEVRVRGLVLDNVPDTLTNEAGATSYEYSYRHRERSSLVGRRVRRVIDEGERGEEGEEEWKCITEIYYGLWALLEHAAARLALGVAAQLKCAETARAKYINWRL